MPQFRTVLEQKIRERRQTLDEFAEYAETFARKQGENGTIGVRHLQRLVANRGPKGQPLGRVRPATARLLEHIFDLGIDELLSAPRQEVGTAEEPGNELRQMLHTSRRIDSGILAVLQDQVTAIRRLDRQLGAAVAHEEVRAKASQMQQLFSHSLAGGTRERLAMLLSGLSTLAGWQALDLGRVTEAWQHYEDAKTAARESGSAPFEAHAAAEQAFVLIDIGETRAAVELLATVSGHARSRCSELLQAWLEAAQGEARAVHGDRDDSLRAFDNAARLLPTDCTSSDGPYVVLDPTHLSRWRGHALARFGDHEAVDVLASALNELDPTFNRAETALRVDLATALTASGQNDDAKVQGKRANELAAEIGSVRQQRRLRKISSVV